MTDIEMLSEDEIEQLQRWRDDHPYSELDMDMHVAAVTGELRAEIERLRALLLRHQVAAWCEEDSDLAVETRAALELKP
jgi:hypothetical protein